MHLMGRQQELIELEMWLSRKWDDILTGCTCCCSHSCCETPGVTLSCWTPLEQLFFSHFKIILSLGFCAALQFILCLKQAVLTPPPLCQLSSDWLLLVIRRLQLGEAVVKWLTALTFLRIVMFLNCLQDSDLWLFAAQQWKNNNCVSILMHETEMYWKTTYIKIIQC